MSSLWQEAICWQAWDEKQGSDHDRVKADRYLHPAGPARVSGAFFMTSLFYKKQTNKALFSVLSVICDLTREESKLSAGTVITSARYSYKSLPPDKTNARTVFNLATANKWSDRTPLALVFAHTCLWKMLLNLVSKISLLGDDRKEPRRGCRIAVESETGAISGSIFPKFLHICTKYPTCHFSPNLSHVFFFSQT